jgi:hypothetical protein
MPCSACKQDIVTNPFPNLKRPTDPKSQFRLEQIGLATVGNKTKTLSNEKYLTTASYVPSKLGSTLVLPPIHTR